MTDWTTADIPSLSGKTAVVTGATGGLGYETAMALAGAAMALSSVSVMANALLLKRWKP